MSARRELSVETERAQNDFVSMLAHELNGPITAILGFARALRDQSGALDEAKRARLLDIVVGEMERLSRLVNDMLDASRMETATLRYDLEPVSLNELVEKVLSVHPSLKERHVVVSNIGAELPPVIGDADRICQVLLNLLSNATRYAAPETVVTIDASSVTEDERDFVRVSVSDDGIGIAPDDHDRVFTKFASVPKPTWIKKGTGLGLFISKGIIEAHGGRMWVDSEPGRGSTFWFTLPAAG